MAGSQLEGSKVRSWFGEAGGEDSYFSCLLFRAGEMILSYRSRTGANCIVYFNIFSWTDPDAFPGLFIPVFSYQARANFLNFVKKI